MADRARPLRWDYNWFDMPKPAYAIVGSDLFLQLEALRELLPTTTIMAVLVNPLNNPAVVETDLRQTQAAAHTLGLQMVHVLAGSPQRHQQPVDQSPAAVMAFNVWCVVGHGGSPLRRRRGR